MAIKDVRLSFGYQQILALTGSTALTIPTTQTDGAVGQRPALALLQAETQNIRWRDDGTAPTAAIGMLLIAGGDPYPFDGDLSRIRFIEVGATAKLNVSYYA